MCIRDRDKWATVVENFKGSHVENFKTKVEIVTVLIVHNKVISNFSFKKKKKFKPIFDVHDTFIFSGPLVRLLSVTGQSTHSPLL